jgi:hypothetical protein
MESAPPAGRGCKRHRGFYAVWAAVVIGAGLASRAEALALPAFVTKYAGDALWALMVFLGLGLPLPRRGTAAVVALAVALCCAVEFGQPYRAPWIDAARRTWPGRLALGDTFPWADIAAYLACIAFGALTEWAVCRASGTQADRNCRDSPDPHRA